MSALPNSTKLRRTKVAIDWYFDTARKAWRFLPVDTTHKVEYERADAAGNKQQPARPAEAKDWVHAAQAVAFIPESVKLMPEPVMQRYGHLVPEAEVA